MASKGWNDYHRIDPVLYNQGYFGECSANQISQGFDDNGDPTTLTYETRDGYIIKATGSNGDVYEFVWE